MPSISIVTPFAGQTAHLLADYAAATNGAQVVIVDNGTPEETQVLLERVVDIEGNVYIRNEDNKGFAAANNQGYARASGDIIIFLNSDVAPTGPWLEQVRKDVREGALYGPSLASQLVAGRHLPYLEGWCIAATRGTWDRLSCVSSGTVVDGQIVGAWQGPWDACCYPGPYWEDNDLALRALQVGVSLIQTQWAISHKGGQTAGPILRHGKSFAENERTFTERALAVLKEPCLSDLWHRYMQAYYTQSDINHHIGLLYSLARGNVVELGTRTGVSTAALLAGVEARGGAVTSIDLEDCAHLFDTPLWTFIQSDSRNPQLPAQVGTPISLLLIDSEHVADVTAAELALWSPYMKPGSHICLHDPETFPGVRRAILDFCERTGWEVTFVLPCNGMAVIEVPK